MFLAVGAHNSRRSGLTVTRNMLYVTRMNRPPLTRYAATVAITVVLGATDEDDADKRLEAVESFIVERLGKTTFARLPGKPRVLHVESLEPSVA